MICVCAWCQRVRTVKGVWKLPETPAQATSKITLTHGICPVCVKKVLAAKYLAEPAR